MFYPCYVTNSSENWDGEKTCNVSFRVDQWQLGECHVLLLAITLFPAALGTDIMTLLPQNGQCSLGLQDNS